MTAKRLVVGCGYLGERVAARWRDAGGEVAVMTRSAERSEALKLQGFAPIVADVAQPATLRNLPAVETVLFAVGYDRQSGLSIEQVYVEGLRHVLEALPSPPSRLVYISSTGVYGETTAAWVDEETPCQPVREGGRACLAAEDLLRAGVWADRGVILRLAGIYGPGRIPRAGEIRAGHPIAAPSEGYVNLIHVDDAAQIVVKAAELTPPRLYVVSDGQPVQRADYYGELARLLGAPPPTFLPPPADAPAAQRAGSDKRVRPARLFADLALRLAYPSYREGLAAIVAGEQGTDATKPPPTE